MGVGAIRNFFNPSAAGVEHAVGTPSSLRPKKFESVRGFQGDGSIGKQLRQPSAWQQGALTFQEKIKNNAQVQAKLTKIEETKITMAERAEKPFKVGRGMQTALENALGQTGGDVARGVLDESVAFLTAPLDFVDRSVDHGFMASNMFPEIMPTTDRPAYHLTRAVVGTAPAAAFIGMTCGMIGGPVVGLLGAGSVALIPVASYVGISGE